MTNLLTIIQGLRKWSVMMTIILIGVIFLSNGMITGAEFVVLIKGVAIAFMGSNAIEHAKNLLNKKGEKEDMSKD